MSGGPPYVAVVGPGEASPAEARVAEEVGSLLGHARAVVLTGGLGGVMEAACRGARSTGAVTVALLPGTDRGAANPAVSVAIATGLGEIRNGLIVRAADVLIAVGGAYGTLSEVALALRTGVPVVGVDTWEIDGVVRAGSAPEAVELALAAVERGG